MDAPRVLFTTPDGMLLGMRLVILIGNFDSKGLDEGIFG